LPENYQAVMTDTRVLIVLTPGFPANEQDSTCLPAQQLFIKKFAKGYPTVTIIVLSLHYPYINTLYHWNGVLVIPFNGRNKKKADKLLLWRKVWKTLRAIRNRETIIGLLSFWCTECALLGHYFSRRFKLLHYCWILGQDAKKDNRFVRFIKPVPLELIALSPFLAGTFERNHNIRPAHMIPNGVDASIDKNVVSNRAIDLLAAGSLIPLKQYDVLIRSVGQLINDFPSLNVVLVGAGPDEARLQNLILDAGLHQHITMKGEMSHELLLELMRQTKIFVHPSSYEGFSTVCLEALHAGAHIVSFCDPVGAMVEQWHIVAGETEMKNKLNELLRDGARMHKSVVPFTMDKSAMEIGKLFNL
jgi:glycosyltransferase involved in cell wall biosynthesis